MIKYILFLYIISLQSQKNISVKNSFVMMAQESLRIIDSGRCYHSPCYRIIIWFNMLEFYYI